MTTTVVIFLIALFMLKAVTSETREHIENIEDKTYEDETTLHANMIGAAMIVLAAFIFL